MFNSDLFGSMKNGSFFINVSRGEIINEKVLIKYLNNKKILAAGLDVIQNEFEDNVSKNILVNYSKNHDNLFISPHIAGLTYDSERKAAEFSLKNINKFFNI